MARELFLGGFRDTGGGNRDVCCGLELKFRMELLPDSQPLTNVEVMELLTGRRKARADSKRLHARREGSRTFLKEARWCEAKVRHAKVRQRELCLHHV